MRRTQCFEMQPLFLLLAVLMNWEGMQTAAQDGSYVLEPWAGAYRDVAIQGADQKIVAAGLTYGDNYYIHTLIAARYTSTGQPDSSFGNQGICLATYPGKNSATGNGLALLPDGKVLVAGAVANTTSPYGPGPSQPALVRLNANGSLDGKFGNGGWGTITSLVGEGRAVQLQSNGKIVMAGTSDNAFVARFQTNGALDTGNNGFGVSSKGKSLGYAFSPVTCSYSTGLAIQGADKPVLTGVPQPYSAYATRFTAAGLLDTTFGTSGFASFQPAGTSWVIPYGSTMQPDGKLVIVGQCRFNNGSRDLMVVRFNANGTLDTNFGGGLGCAVIDMNGQTTNENGIDAVVQADGKIVIAGSVWDTGTDYITNVKVMVTRLNPNGSLDLTYGMNGFKVGGPARTESLALAMQTDGSIIVAGTAILSDTGVDVNHPLIVRFAP